MSSTPKADKETLVKRYGLTFGNGEADGTSEEERRVLARVASRPTLTPPPPRLALPSHPVPLTPAAAAAPKASQAPLTPFQQLDAHLVGALQCVAKGRATIEAMGPPDPEHDLPRVLRDKQMLWTAKEHFDAFQEVYGRVAGAVWNYMNQACAHAPQLVELNAWLRRYPALRSEFVHPYNAPPTGPTAYNVVTSEALFSGYSYTALTFDAQQARVWATHSEADHLLLLHGLYHFWRYAEKAVEIQIGLDRDMNRPEESFYAMWQRWMGKTKLETYASATLFGKNVVHLRRVLNAVLSVLALSASAEAASNKAK